MAGPAQAQLGAGNQGYFSLGNQMAPAYTPYSATLPTYAPAPVIGGIQQTYQPSAPVYVPPPATYPQYLAPSLDRYGVYR